MLLWGALIAVTGKVLVELIGYRYYLDFDLSKLVDVDSPGIPPSETLLIGNGPLSPEQRAIIRNTRPSQVFRFNGMSNLHPGEPVGHLFSRLCDNTTEPRAYWGIAPPPSTLGVIEAVFLPTSSAIRTRFMCNRMTEALGVILLQGRPEDADFYSRYYGMHVQHERCDEGCRKPSLHGAGSWSSGFLGLIHVLQKWPTRRVHVFGMNWAKHPQASHPARMEEMLVQKLVKTGEVVVHRTPAREYHQKLDSGWVLGFRCGEWTPAWLPICYFAPSSWLYGFLPVPPYFADPFAVELPDDGESERIERASKTVLDRSATTVAELTTAAGVAGGATAEARAREEAAESARITSREEAGHQALWRLKKGERERIARLRVNVTQFDADGYVIVENVFSEQLIDELRKRVLGLKHEGTQFGPRVLRAVDPGITIPDFMARQQFSFMHRLPAAPALMHVLRQVFRKHKFRFASHNDIGINRIVGWHKDRLNNEYAHYQSLPLWGRGQPEGGHFIVKALIYLQDHTHDNDAVTIVPGSFLSPDYNTAAARTLHLKKGSVVIFEQRSTHRGRNFLDALLGTLRDDRVLVSIGYGRDNIYTDQFEHGTRVRQANQCGRKCAAQPPPRGLQLRRLPPTVQMPPTGRKGAGKGGGVGGAGSSKQQQKQQQQQQQQRGAPKALAKAAGAGGAAAQARHQAGGGAAWGSHRA